MMKLMLFFFLLCCYAVEIDNNAPFDETATVISSHLSQTGDLRAAKSYRSLRKHAKYSTDGYFSKIQPTYQVINHCGNNANAIRFLSGDFLYTLESHKIENPFAFDAVDWQNIPLNPECVTALGNYCAAGVKGEIPYKVEYEQTIASLGELKRLVTLCPVSLHIDLYSQQYVQILETPEMLENLVGLNVNIFYYELPQFRFKKLRRLQIDAPEPDVLEYFSETKFLETLEFSSDLLSEEICPLFFNFSPRTLVFPSEYITCFKKNFPQSVEEVGIHMRLSSNIEDSAAVSEVLQKHEFKSVKIYYDFDTPLTDANMIKYNPAVVQSFSMVSTSSPYRTLINNGARLSLINQMSQSNLVHLDTFVPLIFAFREYFAYAKSVTSLNIDMRMIEGAWQLHPLTLKFMSFKKLVIWNLPDVESLIVLMSNLPTTCEEVEFHLKNDVKTYEQPASISMEKYLMPKSNIKSFAAFDFPSSNEDNVNCLAKIIGNQAKLEKLVLYNWKDGEDSQCRNFQPILSNLPSTLKLADLGSNRENSIVCEADLHLINDLAIRKGIAFHKN